MMIWLVVAKHPLLWTLFGIMIPTGERMFLRGLEPPTLTSPGILGPSDVFRTSFAMHWSIRVDQSCTVEEKLRATMKFHNITMENHNF